MAGDKRKFFLLALVVCIAVLYILEGYPEIGISSQISDQIAGKISDTKLAKNIEKFQNQNNKSELEYRSDILKVFNQQEIETENVDKDKPRVLIMTRVRQATTGIYGRGLETFFDHHILAQGIVYSTRKKIMTDNLSILRLTLRPQPLF